MRPPTLPRDHVWDLHLCFLIRKFILSISWGWCFLPKNTEKSVFYRKMFLKKNLFFFSVVGRMETWSLSFFVGFFFFWLVCFVYWRSFSSWGVYGDIKKEEENKMKRETLHIYTYIYIHIYIYRIGDAESSNSTIRTASIPVSRYPSSPSNHQKHWKGLYQWNILGFSP